jgi:shikimate dehydrogenase
VKLAVLGDPLAYTRSPDLHRAGAAALGVACESDAIRTPVAALGATLERLAAEGYTGCNLTMPLKAAALAHMQRVSPAAASARSVNTVTFGPEGMDGDSTDGAGFVDLLRALDRNPARTRVLLLGSGGAARSLAWQLRQEKAPGIHVLSRRPPAEDPEWNDMEKPDGWSAWGSPEGGMALLASDVVVNCTPLGRPVEVEAVARNALVVDLPYGPELTPWVREARANGLEAVDGLGLLVHQGRHSLARWLRREVPLAPLSAAVGWPR